MLDPNVFTSDYTGTIGKESFRLTIQIPNKYLPVYIRNYIFIRKILLFRFLFFKLNIFLKSLHG